MSWNVPKLRHRLQIKKAVQTENDTYGSFDISYELVTTVWGSMQPVRGVQEYIEVIRGESISDFPTHEFMIRFSSVGFTFGTAFGIGFSSGFDSIADIASLKSDMFIFVEEGSSSKGRLFQIVDIKRDEERREYLKFRGREIEEQGTGYAA